ncbi:class I SAM-dependent methyltransferase [Ruminococcus difficilis]|uniref:SAM-dependent methyltransferase n=1 Tax=Ruminococcus difficilis TaxID=2763069 RepID=A0A934WU48_9FIRM|nr:class I SAM-dependent methyltransferase [Ruminococcus difficilis]MBK6089967.1 SAM-dependent methyltransferase [Ruminococcus difficilis]
MSILKPHGRLSLCADFVREGSRLADIGTDHGYLPIALCQIGKIPSAIACDINPLPLRSAEENIAKFGLSKMIKTRLSDGLKALALDEVDDIVIAGMGGELIRDILAAAPWVKDEAKHLVLQPMTHHDDLIRWLYENGFDIERQAAVRDDGKAYTVLSTRFTGDKTDCDLYTAIVGKLDPRDENSRGFLSRSLQNLRNKSKGDQSLLPVVQQLEEALYEAE